MRFSPTKLSAIIALLLLALVGFIAFTSVSTRTQKMPRFVAGMPPGALTNLAQSANHHWDATAPFQGDRMWVWSALNRSNYHNYWIDLKDRTVIGELFHAGTEFCNTDQTKIFCSGPNSSFADLKRSIQGWLTQVTGGKWKFQLNREETFYVLDLRNNHTKKLGGLSQYSGSGSSWRPAPGFRFAYNIPSTSRHGEEFYFCDLAEERMERITHKGSIQGWWDEHQLLLCDRDRNLELYDVAARTNRSLFTATQLEAFLKQAGLPEALTDVTVKTDWIDDQQLIYFTAPTNWVRSTSYIVALNPTNSPEQFQVISRNFQLEWLGHFNADFSLYLFPGEAGKPGAGGNGSVHVRNVQTGEERILVESPSSNQYTLPRFYRDQIIYVKNRQIWSIGIDGSNTNKMFEWPTAEKAVEK